MGGKGSGGANGGPQYNPANDSGTGAKLFDKLSERPSFKDTAPQ